jgi:biotin transporter BioY
MLRNLEPMFGNPGADDPRVLILMVAVVLYIAGFVWIRSITSLDEEKPSSWRYLRAKNDADALVKSFVRNPAVAKAPPQPQDPRDLIDAAFAESWRRARRGRKLARLIFAEAISVALVGVVVLVLIVGSNNTSPEPGLWAFVPGVAGVVVGLVWMWRILRADSQPDRSARRYRDF